MTRDLSDVVTSSASGIRLTVRARPKAKHAKSMKVIDVGDGKRAIEVSVAAAPQEGKANKAIVERLAAELGVAKKQIEIVSGETSRLKIVDIRGDPQSLLSKFEKLVG